MINPMNIFHFSTTSKVLLVTLMVSPLAVTAGIYKWTDAQGNVHYSSERPADAEPERLKIDDGAKFNPYADPTVEATKREEAKKAAADEKEASKKAAEEEAAKIPPKPPEPTVSQKGKKILCAQAKREKKALLENPRMRNTDRSFLSPKQHAQRITKANKEIKEYCR